MASESATPLSESSAGAERRRPGQKARTATPAIRFTQVCFAPPAHQAKYRGQTEAITFWAVSTQEVNPAPDRAAICWRLLSTQPVEDAAAAIAAVRRYSQRWQIELFHKILKSGCRIEERQLESAERLGRCLVLLRLLGGRHDAAVRQGGGARHPPIAGRSTSAATRRRGTPRAPGRFPAARRFCLRE